MATLKNDLSLHNLTFEDAIDVNLYQLIKLQVVCKFASCLIYLLIC